MHHLFQQAEQFLAEQQSLSAVKVGQPASSGAQTPVDPYGADGEAAGQDRPVPGGEQQVWTMNHR